VRGGVVGPGPNRRAALGSGPSAARAGVAGRKQRVGNWQAGRGTVSGGGVADRWVRPISGTQERELHARARVGRPEKETEWPSPDEQYNFGFI
jgi:hypothetical protein